MLTNMKFSLLVNMHVSEHDMLFLDEPTLIFLCYGSALRAKKSYFQEALCSKNIRIIELKQMFCWLCDIQNQLALMRKDSQK